VFSARHSFAAIPPPSRPILTAFSPLFGKCIEGDMALKSGRGKDPVDPVSGVSRPPIWAQGSQKPKFDMMAWAQVAEDMARRDLAPVVQQLADHVTLFGTQVQGGAWRVRAAWAQRVLPPHQRVGAAILGLAQVIQAAVRQLLPEPVKPVAAPMARPALQSNEPTLHAIREAMVSQHLPVPQPVAVARDRGWLHHALAWVLLRAMMLVALPVGAVKALLFHLDGGDLHDWTNS
jgi:hypothetical protein